METRFYTRREAERQTRPFPFFFRIVSRDSLGRWKAEFDPWIKKKKKKTFPKNFHNVFLMGVAINDKHRVCVHERKNRSQERSRKKKRGQKHPGILPSKMYD